MAPLIAMHNTTLCAITFVANLDPIPTPSGTAIDRYVDAFRFGSQRRRISLELRARWVEAGLIAAAF